MLTNKLSRNTSGIEIKKCTENVVISDLILQLTLLEVVDEPLQQELDIWIND